MIYCQLEVKKTGFNVSKGIEMMKNIISEKETSDANEYIQKLPAKRKRRRKKCKK